MRATPLPPRTLLHRTQWRDLGVSTARLHGPDLLTVFRGYSTPTAAPASVNTLCEILQNEVIPGAVISHGTAAALLGIPVPWWLDRGIGALAGAAYTVGGGRTVPSTLPAVSEKGQRAAAAGNDPAGWEERLASGFPSSACDLPLYPPSTVQHLIRPPLLHCRLAPGTQRAAGPHVEVHRTSRRASWSPWGIELSHPYVVLLELATILEHDDVVIAVDSLISRDAPLGNATLEKIWATTEHFSASWGAPALRKTLLDARPNTGSPGETRTRLLLRRAGFPEPALNHPVRDPDANTVRYLDLAYPDLMIGVEYDGEYHRRSTRQRREDQTRKDSLESVGWTLRFLNAEDIKKPRRLLTALHRSFTRAGAKPPPPSNWDGRAGQQLGRSLRPLNEG